MTAYVFDTETTGLNDPVIIEAAWMQPNDITNLFSISDCYSERFCPGKPISIGAMAVHHILDEDVATCRPSHEFTLPEGRGVGLPRLSG